MTITMRLSLQNYSASHIITGLDEIIYGINEELRHPNMCPSLHPAFSHIPFSSSTGQTSKFGFMIIFPSGVLKLDQKYGSGAEKELLYK